MHDALLLLGYLTAAASLARAAGVSRAGAALGGRWPGSERRRAPRHREDRRRTAAWFLLAATVAVAGILRVTGGLDQLSQLARDVVKQLGWYLGRGPWQLAATAGAGVAFVGLIVAVIRSRRAHRRQRLAIMAAGLLTTLLAIRAVSWHDAGEVMVHLVAGVRVATWIEGATLLGLVVAGLLAARARRTIRHHGGPDASAEGVRTQAPEASSSVSAASAGSGATV